MILRDEDPIDEKRTITLIAGAAGYPHSKSDPNKNVVAALGDTITVSDYWVYLDKDQLLASYLGIAEEESTENADSDTEAEAAAEGALNGGQDLIAGAGMDAIGDAFGVVDSKTGDKTGDSGAHLQNELKSDWEVWALTNRSREKNKHDTTANAFNLLGGITKKWQNNSGETYGAFFLEHGNASYSTQTLGAGDILNRGDGKIKYTGAGVIAKQQNNSGLYYEGSLRAGRNSNEYANDKLPGYNTSTGYYGAHFGVGYKTKPSKNITLDFYAKALYNKQCTNYFINNKQEKIGIDAINSLRLKTGVRYSWEPGAKNIFYTGIAFEYETRGKITGSVGDVKMNELSLQGSTGVVEAGWTGKINKRLTVDLNAYGTFGQRKGFGGTATLKWAF
jgi:hypothetical protein